MEHSKDQVGLRRSPGRVLAALGLCASALFLLPAAFQRRNPTQDPTQDLNPTAASATTQDPQDPAMSQTAAVRARLDGLKELVERFTKTNEVLSEESAAWREGRVHLQDQIRLMQAEIDGFRTGSEDARTNLAETNTKFEQLTAERAELVESTAALEQVINALEARTLALTEKLPAPLRERLAQSIALIPATPEVAAERKLSLSQRIVPVLSTLSNIEKFQNAVHVEVEQVPVSAGQTAEVSVVYFGLGQAYYISRDQTLAGIGTPGSGGWIWRPDNAIAPGVAQALAILQSEQPAAYVSLPVQVQ